ncbi:hypothetical protein [Chelativorans sp. ZYF759]|uniref:hypothetical protein n=1 Tax=Chelativorans sp. ZYF759 TaxID=2692213 RepID=UPI001AEEDC1F|nr:hypothetical protein [Chelativorans sp. ZYF759]
MMATHSLADALPDFASLPKPPIEERRAASHEAARPVQPAVPQASIKELIALEVERARADTAREWQARHAAEMARQQELHAAEMAELTAQRGTDVAHMIDQHFAALEAQLVDITTTVAARILGASLADDIRDRAVAQLAETIRAALGDGEAVRIRVRGATSLCEALEKSLGAHADQVEFHLSDGFDLSVEIDDAIFETRLSEWSSALSEVF